MMFFQVTLVCALSVALCHAGGYGGSSGGGRSSGRSSSSYGGAATSGGYGGGASSSGYGGGASGYGGGAIPAAIQTRHNIEYKDVPSTGSIQPATIEVGASSIPLNILFRSASSSLNVLQQHQGAGGDTQESNSEDEPHVLKHMVTKPIIQEVREVITPFRKITQEIQPVQEEIQTIVARNSGRQGGQGGSSLGGSQGSLDLGSLAILSAGDEGLKATSGSGLGKGLGKATAGGYGSSAKASSGSTKGGYRA